MLLTDERACEVGGKRKLDIISAYVKPELKAALEVWAEEESRSLSSLMVYLLTKAVKDREESGR